jgi:CHAD domain-containing protein
MKTADAKILESVSNKMIADYNKEFKKLKKGDRSEDTIHDARVAARRLNALLEVLNILRNSPEAKQKTSKEIKRSRQQLSGARDVQITKNFLIKNEENINNFDFNSFEIFYQQFQQKSFKKTNKFIENFKRKEINNNLKKNIKNILKSFNDQVPLNNIFNKLQMEKADLLSEFSLLDVNDLSTFHQLRKDLKKMRYKLEIINEISAENYNIINYKDFQDKLGEIQDIVVIKEILNNRFKSADNNADLEDLNDFLDKQQKKLINEFFDKKELFLEMMNKF